MEPTKQPNKITVDWGSLSACLGSDLDYMPYKFHVFLRHRTGEVTVVFTNDDDAGNVGLPPTENQSRRLDVEANPQDVLEIPIPDHATWHKWFQEFLEDLGRPKEYFGSIGGWLKEHADDVHAWRDYKRERVVTHAVEVAAKAGITLTVV